jgi:multiple sugar transport system permease protein
VGPLSGGIPIATATAARVRPASTLVPRPLPAPERRRRFLLAVANHSVAIGLGLIFLLPFVFVVLTSLMPLRQTLTSNLWPHPFVFANYPRVFKLFDVWRYTGNTVMYAVLTTIGVVLSSVPVAYALSRMSWRGRQVAFLVVLSTLMLPTQVTIVPLYIIFVKLHWIGSLKPLIVPSFFGDAFSIFLLRQFFLTIPQELSDAARVDGAGEFQILMRVIVPLAKPGIMAIALFQFLFAWNDFFNPLIYSGSNPNTLTFSVGITQLLQTTEVHFGVLWNVLMAGAVLFTIPVIVLFFLSQKVFIEGVTLTGVKG